MAVEKETLSGLAKALDALNVEPHHPVPTGVIAALAGIARPGLRLSVDVCASEELGAPLITIEKIHDDEKLIEGLTKRQKQVAKLMLNGQSNRQIASDLGISVATTKDHVHAILDRLGLPSRGALIAASRSVSQW
jgi:DNA-binding NarL/FixJ family response regulator